MTIRILLIATFLMAIAFSLLRWNWGIAAFVTACVPLALYFLCAKTRPSSHLLRFPILALSLFLIYVFSFGPYMAQVESAYGLGDAPPIVDAVTRTLYAPHWSFLEGTQDYEHDYPHISTVLVFFDAYENEWICLGGDLGVFFRALHTVGR
ncbi:hypothetical protein SH528x_002952 [Novipirellula sp. SH528]|uniref:hypothetical protein n=1 Tax=Novipirellula sp. SH528 TaxID=3454466 RepID=UPI003FA0DC7E